MKLRKRKLVGYVGVDSAQLIITDPCYLKDFKSNDFEDKEFYTVKHPDGQEETVTIRSERWWEIVDDINSKKIEVLKKKGEWETKSRDYSYAGCCRTTLSPEKAGPLNNDGFCEVGVVTSTGWGDGSYPVYATYNEEGRVVKVEVKFD